MGSTAMLTNTTGSYNTGLGDGALQTNSTGSNNTAVGDGALQYSTSNDNTAVGNNTAMSTSTGGYNTVVGQIAMQTNTTGSHNTVLGYAVASVTLDGGSNNVLIGTTADIETATAGTSNTIQIGAGSRCVICITGTGTPRTAAETYHGSIAFPEVTTGTNADFVCMSAGNVVTLQTTACTISSRRFKEDIVDMQGSAMPALDKMEVASFKLKDTNNKDPNARSKQIGLIAENIAQVAPECAVYENDMKTPKSYRQECVIALLVKAVQEQQQEIAALKRH
jgi:hypothetical protein